uniref:Uncharacterized protein n=1 Tax=Oryza meridionalis TaxID=40149 RepID=A0A0E0DR86_9ORYZ
MGSAAVVIGEEDLLESGGGLPLAVTVRARSRYRMVGSLVRLSYRHDAQCVVRLRRTPWRSNAIDASGWGGDRRCEVGEEVRRCGGGDDAGAREQGGGGCGEMSMVRYWRRSSVGAGRGLTAADGGHGITSRPHVGASAGVARPCEISPTAVMNCNAPRADAAAAAASSMAAVEAVRERRQRKGRSRMTAPYLRRVPLLPPGRGRR